MPKPNNNGANPNKKKGGPYDREPNDTFDFSDAPGSFHVQEGDPEFTMGDGRVQGGHDTLIGEDFATNVFSGDVFGDAFGDAKGGNDDIYGGDFGENFITGDAYFMADQTEGGNDDIWGGENSLNYVYGDAYGIEGALGGNDDIWGGAADDGESGYGFATNILLGDSFFLGEGEGGQGGAQEVVIHIDPDDPSLGGHDDIWGGDANGNGFVFNVIGGDAVTMYEAIGGNDELSGGSAIAGEGDYSVALNLISGDAIGGDLVAEALDEIGSPYGGISGPGPWPPAFFFVSDPYGGGVMEHSQGGNDEIAGGDAVAGEGGYALALNGIVGDGDILDEFYGGNDEIDGGDAIDGDYFGAPAVAFNVLIGDGVVLYDSFGGNDEINGGDVVGDDDFDWGFVENTIIGDGVYVGTVYDTGGGILGLQDISFGGNDDLTGGSVLTDGYGEISNEIYGDAIYLGVIETEVGEPFVDDDYFAVGVGGNDTIIGGDSAEAGEFGYGEVYNELVGDADYMGVVELNTLEYGEFDVIAIGGDDTITGGSADTFWNYVSNYMVGDGIGMGVASDAEGYAIIDIYVEGGDDTITGGDGYVDNWLIGDGEYAAGGGGGEGDGEIDIEVEGGDDTLIAGDNMYTSVLVGDFQSVGEGDVTYGDDTLVSGKNDDTMWGDLQNGDGGGGEDVFVFSPEVEFNGEDFVAMGNGDDWIGDFEIDIDQIDLSAFGFASYAEVEALMTDTGADVRIDFSGDDGSGSITIAGIDEIGDLSASDFIL